MAALSCEADEFVYRYASELTFNLIAVNGLTAQ